MGEVLALVLGVGFLQAFFRAVQTQWPEAYHSLTSGVAPSVSVGPLRYGAYRFGPVYVTCLCAAVSLERARLAVIGPTILIAVAHTILTVGRSALVVVRNWPPTRPTLLVMHAFVLVGVLLSSFLALATRRSLDDIVPDLDQLTTALWTGAISAVLAVALLSWSTSSHGDESMQFARSRKMIPNDLWQRAATDAVAVGANPDFVHAIMIVENLQRPPWFRWIERLVGRTGLVASYGILQVRADRPMTDSQSVTTALNDDPRRFTVGPKVWNPDETDEDARMEYIDSEEVMELARRQNPSDEFAMLVLSALSWVEDHGEPPDGAPGASAP